jgi:hypothetical protein
VIKELQMEDLFSLLCTLKTETFFTFNYGCVNTSKLECIAGFAVYICFTLEVNTDE